MDESKGKRNIKEMLKKIRERKQQLMNIKDTKCKFLNSMFKIFKNDSKNTDINLSRANEKEIGIISNIITSTYVTSEIKNYNFDSLNLHNLS